MTVSAERAARPGGRGRGGRGRKKAAGALLLWTMVVAVVAWAALSLLGRDRPCQALVRAGAFALEHGDPPTHAAALRVTFLDVGQGDAVLIQAPGGKTALVDAGRGSAVADTLRRLGVHEIDLLVASHAHTDHIGGMDDVLERFRVRNFMDNGLPHTTQAYERLMAAVEAEDSMTYLTAERRTLTLGEASVEVLPMLESRCDQNNRSVALVVRYGEFSVFLSGDSETPRLNFLTRGGMVPDVTVLKAPHHGAETGFAQDFLDAARPEVIVVSVGNPNAYDHPSASAIAAYEAAAATVLRTDRDGRVTILGRRSGAYEVELR